MKPADDPPSVLAPVSTERATVVLTPWNALEHMAACRGLEVSRCTQNGALLVDVEKTGGAPRYVRIIVMPTDGFDDECMERAVLAMAETAVLKIGDVRRP